MAPSSLEEALRKRAVEAAESIMRTARADADGIRADAERAIEERRSAVLGSREDDYEAEARTSIAAERHEAMRIVLLAKTRLIDRVLQRARAQLPSKIGTDAYRVGLPEEVEQALAFVGTEGAIIRCSEPLAATLGEALQTHPEVPVHVADDGGSGFTVIGEAGRVRVDCTLETRLERLAPTLAIEVHERLEDH